MKYGSITTGIIADGLVLNMDPANRASTIPSTSTLKTFNTLDTTISGSIVTDATWANGTPPTFNFDGSDGYILTNYLGISAVTKCTISIWAKTSNLNLDLFLYGNRADSPTNHGIAGQTYSNGNFYSYVSTSSYVYWTMSFNRLSNDTWFNYVFIFDGSQSTNSDRVRIYTNGISVSYTKSGTFPSVLQTSDKGIEFAKDQRQTNPWNGDIGNFQIYNRALSANEVLHNYNALKGRFGL
jgi:hypothetical protein